MAPVESDAGTAGALVRAGAVLLTGLVLGVALGGIRVGVALAGAIVMLLPWHPRTGPPPDRRSHVAGWRLIGFAIALVGGGEALGQLLDWPVSARLVLPGVIALPAVAVGLRLALTRRGRVRRVVLDALLISLGVTLLGWQWVWHPLVGDDGAAAGAFIGLAVMALSMGTLMILSRGAAGLSLDRVLLLAAGFAYVGGAMLVEDIDLVQRSWAAAVDACGHVLAASAVVLGQRTRAVAETGPRDVVVAVRWPPTAIGILALLSSIALVQVHEVPPGDAAELLQGALVLALAGRFVQAGRDWRAAWSRLEASVCTDEVTGLGNRAWLSGALPDLLRTGSVAGVVLVDIDRFKLINDALGHNVGDELLHLVGERLGQLAGPGVVRSGGDEFLVLVDAAGGQDPIDVAAAVHRCLAVPVRLGAHGLRLTASVGVATAEPGATAEALLRDAESALYRAKDDGGDQVAVFDERMRREARDRLHAEQALRRAAASGDVRFVYEPVVDAVTGAVVQLRALSCCEAADDGCSPARLRNMAELDGIVGRPTWLLDVVCRALSQLCRTPGWEEAAICIDVSATRLRHSDFAAQVQHALQAAGVEPRRLVLAVPEEAVLDPSGSAGGPLRDLDALGVRLALRGFGSGYTALGSLPSMPIELLNLDASFTRRLGTSLRPSLVGIIIDMAHRLGMQVVAEGVQTAAQRTQLAAMGCDLLVGTGVGVPTSLQTHLAARSSDPLQPVGTPAT